MVGTGMNVLVTGHLGTLGQPLVRELRARGHVVHGVDLRHSEDGYRVDVADYRQIRAVLERQHYDIVYHLAAEFGRHNGEDFFEQCWRTNVIGTRNILELQRDLGAEYSNDSFRLVMFSSSEVYGELDAEWLSEDLMDTHAVHWPNDYATSKWVNEVQCVNFARQWGNEIVRVRLFNAYGPGEAYHAYRSVVCLFAYRLLHGLPIDVFDGYHRVFQYVDDLIPTLANIAERFAPGEVYNIGGAEYRSVNELADLVLRETGADPSLVRLLPHDAHNRKNKRPDITKARRDLGHNPTVTLEQGVPWYVAWMRERYGLGVPVPTWDRGW